MNIQLLLTGNELMAGHTVDSNSASIAEKLAHYGFTVGRKVTIGDDFELLVSELTQLSTDSDVLIVNGGLGPTSDDLTAQALSDASKQPLEKNTVALEHLTSWCKTRNLQLNEANLKQTILPKGVDIIPNPNGSAVGFCMELNHCLVICTPGVPSELNSMLDQTIVDLIRTKFPQHEPGSTIRFQTFGLGESSLQQLITNHYQDWPQEVILGFRSGIPLLEIKLTIHHQDHSDIQQKCYQKIRDLIGEYIIGEQSTTLAEAVISLLKSKNQTITTAESCTGGKIATHITQVPGASEVFEAGFVTYSNKMKQKLLNVDSITLEEQGAVSENVVKQMAFGAIEKSNADFAIAVSGVAGPTGGSEEKPVGTVWIAWGTKETLKTQELHINASRLWFQNFVTATTLDLIRRELLSIEAEPRYFKYLSKK